ncbi:MAG: DUF1028 domain-containing protein [Solirubrobacteraceae bacterium]
MTYSIVARDQATGEFGVAVQSHWFGVGSIVPWLRPGAGAVATQSIPELRHGPESLHAMAGGGDAGEVLRDLIADDPAEAYRQVGIVDRNGQARAFTGASCIPHAGQATGDGYTCQANMMERDTVPAAMAAAFEAGEGKPFGDRLLAALDAAEGEGGDVRGRQSAALVIAPADGEPWERDADLRVEDHPDPLVELRRLLGLRRAYALADTGDALSGAGRLEEAARAYADAAAAAPGNAELRFFAGLGAAQAGDLDAGVAQVRAAIEGNPRLAELLRRVPADMAPAAPAVRERLDAS